MAFFPLIGEFSEVSWVKEKTFSGLKICLERPALLEYKHCAFDYFLHLKTETKSLSFFSLPLGLPFHLPNLVLGDSASYVEGKQRHAIQMRSQRSLAVFGLDIDVRDFGHFTIFPCTLKVFCEYK